MKNTSNQKCWLIILGMHRSGTSALSGCLQSAGVEFGKDLYQADGFNPKGYLEHNELISINETILKELDASMHYPFAIRDKLANGWQPAKSLTARMQKLLLSAEYANSNICGLKDPRLSVLLVCWEPVFKLLGHSIKCLISYRKPQEVALSLYKRENVSPLHAEWMWCAYNLDAELYSREFSRKWISYQQLLENPNLVLTEINDAFNLNLPVAQHNFIEKTLQHHKISNDETLQFPLAKKLFAEVQKSSKPDDVWQLLQQDYKNHLQHYQPYLQLIVEQWADLKSLKKSGRKLSGIKNKIAAFFQKQSAFK